MKIIVTKPNFKKLIQIYDINVKKCGSLNLKGKRKNKWFLQEEQILKNQEEFEQEVCPLVQNIFIKLDKSIMDMSLRTIDNKI